MGTLIKDKKFMTTMIRLASPIMVQYLIFSSLGLVDGLMIGQLGDGAVAAVGVANQIFFLVNLLLFGITSGTAIFIAQYWGQKDLKRIQSILGLSLTLSTAGSLIFSLAGILIPVKVISIYSTDPEVLSLGSSYLQIVAFSYVLTAITNSFSTALRSTENVKLPMLISLLALSFNTIINYLLILGNFGFPALGVTGAAIATLISRVLETGTILFIIYQRELPVAGSLSALLNFKILPIRRVLRTTLPVIATEIGWSFGIATYNVVYARIGTESIAAVNIATTLDRIIFVVFIGLGNACAIMLGNRIGADENDLAIEYSRKFLILGVFGAIMLGAIMLVFATPLLSLYKVSAETIQYTYRILIAMAISLPVRSINLIILVGILRSGGDTRFAFIVDAGMVWLIGVPLALLGAFVFHLPIYLVYPMVLVQEIVTAALGLKRVLSNRWIHSLTSTVDNVQSIMRV